MKNINGEERLKNVLCGDKKQNPEKMKKIVKAEVFQLLKNYFEIDGDGLSSTPLWKSVSSADAKSGSNSNDEERDQAHEEKEWIAHSVGLQR